MDNKRKALIYFEMDENGVGRTEVRGYERDLKVGLLMLLEKIATGTNQDIESIIEDLLIVIEKREELEKEIKNKKDLKRPENVIPIDRDKK